MCGSRRPRVRVQGLRRRSALACTLGLVLAGALFCPGEAFAAEGHAFLSAISEAAPGSRLLAPDAAVVDGSTGQVFVSDVSAGYVDVFSSAGVYQTRIGEGFLDGASVAVDESNGDVYVAEPLREVLMAYEPDGMGYRLLGRWSGKGLPGQGFGELAAVAVDDSTGPSSGDLYVLEGRAVGSEDGAVDVFKPKPNPENPEEVREGEGEEGQFLRRLSGPKLEAPNAVAVSSSSGRVLVADSVRGAIDAFSPEGVFEEKLGGKGAPYGAFSKEAPVGDVAAVAIEDGSGDIYVAEAERHVVSQYSPSGEWEGWITSTPSGDLGEPRGVALTPAGEVLVADAAFGVVDRFAAAALVPDVETGKVAKSALTRTSALLPGVIDGEGSASSYRFQYGETPALVSETATHSSGAGEEAVSATAEGLKAGRIYYYRIVGENEEGTNYGLIRQFETPPAVEGLETGAVEAVAPRRRDADGRARARRCTDPLLLPVRRKRNLRKDRPRTVGRSSCGQDRKGRKTAQERSKRASRALPRTRSTTTGWSQKTNTARPTVPIGRSRPPVRPGSPMNPPRGSARKSATIHANVDPDQLATSYRFQYGETTAYGSETPVGGQSIGSGSSPVAVSASLSGLKVGSTYHFRVIAENEAGITNGEDQTFTTIPSAPVDATFVTGVSASEATLHTQINPLGHDTSYYFQYGTRSCQENPAACTNIPSSPGRHRRGQRRRGTRSQAERPHTGTDLSLPRPRLKQPRRHRRPRTQLHDHRRSGHPCAARSPRLGDGHSTGQGRSPGGSAHARRRADPGIGRRRKRSPMS